MSKGNEVSAGERCEHGWHAWAKSGEPAPRHPKSGELVYTCPACGQDRDGNLASESYRRNAVRALASVGRAKRDTRASGQDGSRGGRVKPPFMHHGYESTRRLECPHCGAAFTVKLKDETSTSIEVVSLEEERAEESRGKRRAALDEANDLGRPAAWLTCENCPRPVGHPGPCQCETCSRVFGHRGPCS